MIKKDDSEKQKKPLFQITCRSLLLVVIFALVFSVFHYKAVTRYHQFVIEDSYSTARTIQLIFPPLSDNARRIIMTNFLTGSEPYYSFIAIINKEYRAIYHSDPLRVGMEFKNKAIDLVFKTRKPTETVYQRDAKRFGLYTNEEVYVILIPYFEQGTFIGVIAIGVHQKFLIMIRKDVLVIEIILALIFIGVILIFAGRDYLYESKVSREVEKHKNLLLRVLESFSVMSEIKDPYTVGHQLRVAVFAKKIAERMGLSPDEIEVVQVSGLLHDIGKVFLPEQILNKRGRLTEEEYEIVKLHPYNGYSLVKNIDFKGYDISDSVLHHHERMDGKGYPHGLKGEEINILSRIISVADAIEAMSYDRPYRKALSKEEIVNELLRCRGKQFDGDIVDKSIAILMDPSFNWKDDIVTKDIIRESESDLD